MSRRGFSLIGMIWFVGLAFTLMMGSWLVVEGSRNRIVAHKNRQMATAMAVSGLDYARAVIVARGQWANARPSPEGTHAFVVESPDLGTGRFVLEVTPLQGGRCRVVSEGQAAGVTRRLVQVLP